MLTVMIPSEVEFEKAVQKILQYTEYAPLRNSLRDFVDRIKDALIEWLDRLFARNNFNEARMPEISDKLSIVFMITGIVIVALIIAFIIVKGHKAFEKRERIKEILGEEITERTTPDSLKRRAAGLREHGKLRESIRYDFIALLLHMHERNILYLDETKTNEEIYNYLKKNKFLMLAPFKSIVSGFNSTWYGNKPPERIEEWSSNINLLWNEVSSHEGKNK
jgi:hypothetical protein